MEDESRATSRQVTKILNSIHEGNARASDQLIPLVYDELRRIALLYFAGLTGEEAGNVLGVSTSHC
jgi:hypothetical protein